MKKTLILFSLFLLVLAACSSGEKRANEANYNPAYDTYEKTDYGYSEGVSSYSENVESDRKIAKNYNVEIKNKDVITASKTLKELINKYQGYIIYSYENNNSDVNINASYTVRIPSKSSEQFNEDLNTVGTLESISLNSSDLTDSYKDYESRLNAYKTQESRLLELMGKAETISDLIVIEEKLVEVQRNIEYITSELQNIDKIVDYSTYGISISAPFNYQPQKTDFLSKLLFSISDSLSGFINFIQDIVIVLIYLMPYIVILLFVIFIFKKITKTDIKNIFNKKNLK